jgi:carbonic anhydrase
MSDFYKKILDNNKKWVETSLASDLIFADLAKGQTPPLLWIGCSDSRSSKMKLWVQSRVRFCSS